MNVVGHNHEIRQMVADFVEVQQGLPNNRSQVAASQDALAMPAVEMVKELLGKRLMKLPAKLGWQTLDLG